MGFSTGGSAALLALGLFIAFGTFQAATTERLEHVTDAKDAVGEDRLDRINTEINITEADWGQIDSAFTLTIRATNNGTTALPINDTDVIVDGNYEPAADFSSETVDGIDTHRSRAAGVVDATSVWLPGETYEVQIVVQDLESASIPDNPPERVKLTVQGGVSDSKEVS